MPDQSSNALSVDPARLADLAFAYEQAALTVGTMITELQRGASLPRAWADDPVSGATAEHYRLVAFDGPESTYRAFSAYQQELRSIAGVLRSMLAGYNTTEADVAAAFASYGQDAAARRRAF